MADYEGESERVWDEFQWERFLQQQDQKTEKYMELLEKYVDDPHRDEIIAREMGWSQLLGSEDWDDDDETDSVVDDGWRADTDESESADEVAIAGFADHSLYRAAFALTVWIDKFLDENLALQNEPAAVKLVTHAAMASAKIAAALSDDDGVEIGMTIAYLKRALKAITTCIDSAAQLLSAKQIVLGQHAILEQRLFQVRDGLVDLMGEYRSEWRRRFGPDDHRG